MEGIVTPSGRIRRLEDVDRRVAEALADSHEPPTPEERARLDTIPVEIDEMREAGAQWRKEAEDAGLL
jgi:hypothetical protein